MEEPTEHLIDTINALDDQLQAALILVYVHQAGFDPSGHDVLATQAVVELTGCSLAKIQDCFTELKGSFLKLSGPRWTFSHPTISDALTEILRQKPHMMAALIRGATIDTILNSFSCEGTPQIRDALVVPTTLDEALVTRLVRTPDERGRNWMLFHFLAYRASDNVLVKSAEQAPDLLRRYCWQPESAGNNPQIAAYARAHYLGILPHDLRSEAAEKLETALLTGLDVSFFDEPNMLALVPPLRLVSMGMALRTTVLPSLEERIDEIIADADLDEEPDSHFRKLLEILDRAEEIGVDADATALIDDTRIRVKRSIDELAERKLAHEDGSEDETDWTHILAKDEQPSRGARLAEKRSVFDDVDK